MAQWTDPSRTFLIQEIRTRPIVWDRDVSNDSTHKAAKQKAFSEVAKALNEAFPSISSKFTGEDVRSQWKNLKDTFVRKLRYLHEGKYAYDSQKEPTWKFYRMLSFLDDKKKERLSPESSLFDISSLHRDHRSFSIDLPKGEPFENSNESASSQEVLQILADQLKNDKNESSLCSLNPGSPNQSGDSISGISSTCLKTDSPKTPTGGESVEEEEEPRRKKTCQRCVRNTASVTNDEFDLFGSLVAAQLRRLAEENSRSCSLRLQKALNDVMYESQMDLLAFSSHLDLSTKWISCIYSSRVLLSKYEFFTTDFA
ncbi:unnamed protein product [Auanema sp. JU1783]|nr:unnamed protein product [Auanema sp. JU1783]